MRGRMTIYALQRLQGMSYTADGMDQGLQCKGAGLSLLLSVTQFMIRIISRRV